MSEDRSGRLMDGTTRRRFLRMVAIGSGGTLLAACAPSSSVAAPTATAAAAASAAASAAAVKRPVATAKATWQADWDKVLAAAKQEGSVVVAGPPGDQYRTALVTSFEKAYPGIKVAYTGASGRDLAPKLLAERQAGQFLWDVSVGGPTTAVTFKNQQVFDPLPAALILPEILDDSKWFGGFNKYWIDNEGQFIFPFEALLRANIYVNRDIVKESDLGKYEQLLDPKFQSKISWNDPRTFGAGSAAATSVLIALGEPFLRKLYQQGVVATTDLRQQAEWVVRGTYPIAGGLDTTFLLPFQQQGLGKNVLPLDKNANGGNRLELGFGGLMRVNRPPHPNAQTVYLNWLLTKDGQQAWVQNTARNSRRLDVAGPQETMPDQNANYIDTNGESSNSITNNGVKIAQELIK
jgi:ABC-type Fe3+ transport system substrate-binding protein